MNRIAITTLATLSLALAAGCGGEETAPTQDAFNICEEGDFETPYDAMTVGLTKTGEAELLKVSLMQLSPSPPVEDEENVWTVQLLDMNDAPLTGATLMNAEPFMPDHGHGSQQIPEIGDTAADGTVEIRNILFQMPGVWTITLTVDDGGAVDTATFGLCILS
jgi:YtkA-like